MYKFVNVFDADKEFSKDPARVTAGIKEPDGSTKWVISRPIGYSYLSLRIKCAWEVLMGRADIVKFYKQ